MYSIVCLLCCIHISSFAQTIAFNNSATEGTHQQNADQSRTLKSILSELESRYGVSFIYKSELTDLKIEEYEQKKFSTLDETLTGLLKPRGLAFKKIRDNFYVVTRSSNSKFIRKISNQLQEDASQAILPSNQVVDRIGRLGLTLSSLADIGVSGRVTSENDEGLPGVNVTMKGATLGTVTDANGSYSLTVPENATLIFSYIGYVTEEVAVGNRTTINVKLIPDIKSLSEVVVVGYGTQERAKVTGAISSVSSEEITALPVASLDAALQGRAAGVTITNRGAPGTNPTVRIRGVGTVGNTDPLYVIDGVPAGGLNAINPNDIESIEVLKDAASAAIYGSRAANGVILVTTKKGARGKTKITADAYFGVQQAWRQLDLLDRDQYIAYGTDLLQNANAALPDRFSNLGEFANVNTDWQDAMFRTAPIQDYNLGISGGTDNALFNISGGYFNQKGIMLGTDFQRASFRANTSFKFGRVDVGQTLAIAYTDQNNEPFIGGRSQLEHMIKSVPYIPVRDPNRPGGFRAPDRVDGSDPENPVLNATLRKNNTQNMKLLGTAFASVDLIGGLKYRFQMGLDMNYSTNQTFSPSFNAGDFSVSPNATLAQTRNTYVSPVLTNQLSFNRTFGAHTVDAVAVVERQTSVFTSLNAGGQNALTNEITIVNSNALQPNIGGNRAETALLSYIGRVNYDYNGKYLLSASIRRDGASRFAPGKKWGWFPAVSAGWRISQESFMEAVPIISDLKLRASYGLTGNWQIGDYGYLNTISGNHNYKFAGASLLPAYTVSNLASTNIQWESTAMANVGLDMGFFEDRLTASVEWFSNETRDMLLPVPIPPSLGYDGAPTENVGNVTNKGFEFMLGYRKTAGAFQWSVNGNISFIRNEFTNLGKGTTIFGPGFEGDPVTYTEVGQPIAYFLGWKVDRIYQTQEEINNDNALDGNSDSPYQNNATAPGDIRFLDLNNDGVINASDRTNIGHFLPDFSYGVNATANWKNFDLTLFIQGVSGNEILNTNLYDLEGMTRLFNSGTAVLNRWTPTNTNTNVPRAIANDPNRNSRISSRFVESGSYLRIKNLSVGYTLPGDLLKSVGNGFISSIRVYVSTSNLLTLTKYSGYDPEIGVRSDITGANVTLSNGVDYGQFPQARTIFGGIQLGF
jgi:TonB-linked SusC/RagA family outer membrane protein